MTGRLAYLCCGKCCLWPPANIWDRWKSLWILQKNWKSEVLSGRLNRSANVLAGEKQEIETQTSRKKEMAILKTFLSCGDFHWQPVKDREAWCTCTNVAGIFQTSWLVTYELLLCPSISVPSSHSRIYESFLDLEIKCECTQVYNQLHAQLQISYHFSM